MSAAAGQVVRSNHPGFLKGDFIPGDRGRQEHGLTDVSTWRRAVTSLLGWALDNPDHWMYREGWRITDPLGSFGVIDGGYSPPPAGAEIPSGRNAPARSARAAARLVGRPHGSPGRSGCPANADRSPDLTAAEFRRPWRRSFFGRSPATRPGRRPLDTTEDSSGFFEPQGSISPGSGLDDDESSSTHPRTRAVVRDVTGR